MRKMISLSALVSGLLASPGFAAVEGMGAVRPRAEEIADCGAAVLPQRPLTQAAWAGVQEALVEMVEKGPEDMGGMRALQRRLAEEMREHLGEVLAAEGLKTPKEGMEGLIGDFGLDRPLAPVWPQPQGTVGEPSVDWWKGLPPTAIKDFQRLTHPVPVGEQRTEKAGFLGVTTSRVGATLREQLQLPKGIGLVVDFVAKDSPAEAAGLKVHDVLTKFEDQWLVNLEQLAVLVRAKKPGDAVVLTVIRAGKEMKLTAKLVEKEVPVMEEEGLGGARPGWVFPPGPQGRMEMPEGWQKNGQLRVMVGDDGTLTTTWVDADNEITLKKDKEGKNSIVAKDQSGKEVYHGPYTTDEDKARVPAELAATFKKMQANADRMNVPIGGNEKAGVAPSGMATVMSRSDETHTMTLSMINGQKTVVVKDAKTGKVIYEGPADTEEDLKKMPEGVAEKVRKMEGKAGVGR